MMLVLRWPSKVGDKVWAAVGYEVRSTAPGHLGDAVKRNKVRRGCLRGASSNFFDPHHAANPLVGGAAIPFHSLSVVPRQTPAVVIHEAEIVLRFGKTLI